MLSLLQNGVEVCENYLSPGACSNLLRDITAYASSQELPLIERAEADRSLRYRVIDGDRIFRALPRVVSLYHDVLALVRERQSNLEPISNPTASLNVNLTPPGGEYRWHYDRNVVTAILFLNSVAGGQTEMYPNFRLHLGRWKDTRVQRLCDRTVRRLTQFQKAIVVDPQPGRMLLMCGDRCLHSVRRVEGDQDRISVIMAFDPPGQVFGAEKGLDSYLYSDRVSREPDPNYRR